MLVNKILSCRKKFYKIVHAQRIRYIFDIVQANKTLIRQLYSNSLIWTYPVCEDALCLWPGQSCCLMQHVIIAESSKRTAEHV